jgi:hypothetical protein
MAKINVPAWYLSCSSSDNSNFRWQEVVEVIFNSNIQILKTSDFYITVFFNHEFKDPKTTEFTKLIVSMITSVQ